MKNIFVKFLAVCVVVTSVLCFTRSASAVATMTISDGIDPTVTVTTPGAGIVEYNGSMGSWSIIVNTGETTPALGSSSAPQLDLNYDVTSTGSGTLTIKFSNTGYTSLAGFTASIGGTTQGSVVFTTYASVANTLFGTSTPLTSQSFSTSPFSGSASAGGVGSTPYSLTEQLVITHGSGTLNDSGDALLATVPDGGATIILVGTSLVALGLVGCFFKRC